MRLRFNWRWFLRPRFYGFIGTRRSSVGYSFAFFGPIEGWWNE